MYGDYWNFTRLPFENSCDPLFFFRGRSHEAAFLKLQYVIEQSKGVAVLVGEHGVGKTYVSRVLEAEFGNPPGAMAESPQDVPFVRLMFPRLSADEVLSFLATRLTELAGLPVDPGEAVVRTLERALRWHADRGARPAFVVDDAHLIESPQVLQVLAQLVGLCEAEGLSLSVTLLGQPELMAHVQRVPALNSRLAVRAGLHPLGEEETHQYIRHRLDVAGLEECVFDEGALAAFHRLSLGFPRRINQLCDLALLVGYADELPSLSSGEVEAAAEELLTVATE